MKPPKKPFTVEFKQARRVQRKPHPSIWGTLDLKVSANEQEPGSQQIDPQRLPKPVTPDSPEPAKAQRILPALAKAPAPELMEMPSIERSTPKRDDPEDFVQAPEASNALTADPGGVSSEVPKVRRRYGNSGALPAGERWKRRLPPILRQTKSVT